MGHLVSIHGFLHVGLEPRPQEEFPHKQVLHHPLHVTEPSREGCGIVGKRLDETRLRGYNVAVNKSFTGYIFAYNRNDI